MLNLTVFPDVNPVEALALVWVAYDPVGDTTAELGKLGLSVAHVDLGDDVSGVDVLVIGSRALDGTKQLPFTREDVRRGMRVVVFEQDQEALRAFGFRVEDVVPRYVFPRVADHPVLAGLGAEDLVNWRGEGQLVPATKRSYYPYPDHRVHWGNYGSVASVVVETPHKGAFTPILEAEFDLAYSPLLEWRDGAGLVLFVQLDLTGRVSREPAADRVARNLIAYLDGAAADASEQDQEIVYIGSQAEEEQFLEDLGFALVTVEPGGSPSSPTLRDLRGRIAILGQGVPAELPPTTRRQIEAHVKAGGTVLLLPQTAAQHEQAGWPLPVTARPESLARVDAAELAGGSLLLRGVGPQLLRWRSFLDLEPIAAEGLPPRTAHLLDGLLIDHPDGRGRWILSQTDWRQLDSGDNNTRRSRWNVRKLYRQVLTNLGARTGDGEATAMLAPSSSFAPLVDVTPWRASTDSETVPFSLEWGDDGWYFRTLAGLREVYETDSWPGTSGDWGRVLDADSAGFVSLAPTLPSGQGTTGYLRTYVYTSHARTVTFSLGAATWLRFSINGETLVDQSRSGAFFAGPAPVPGEITVPHRLEPGWNQLELLVTASWVEAFGCWIQMTDPGDLLVEATIGEPGEVPPPPTNDLLPEPRFEALYTELLPGAEDVYRHLHW